VVEGEDDSGGRRWQWQVGRRVCGWWRETTTAEEGGGGSERKMKVRTIVW
jgi:hypothetical protein